MKHYYFYLCLLLLSCEKEDKSGFFQVRGRVFYNTSAAAKVIVSIDDVLTLTTETSEDGSFVINNVSPGEHKLVIQKTFEQNGAAFTEKSYKLFLTADVELDNLQLSDAVFLSNDLTDASSVALHWSQTNDPLFQEYKIYRHTAGLDETPGLLVHISPSISDTVFVDEDVFPNTAYFYRVYAMDKNFGKIAGSNIVETKTNSKELLMDGSFETVLSTDHMQINWQFNGCPVNQFRLNHDEAFKGSRSIEITQGEDFCYFGFRYKHLIPIDDVMPGQKMRFTFKYKGATSSMSVGVFGIGQGQGSEVVGSDSEWKTYSHDFIVIEGLSVWDNKFSFSISLATSAETTILVDDVSLKAVD